MVFHKKTFIVIGGLLLISSGALLVFYPEKTEQKLLPTALPTTISSTSEKSVTVAPLINKPESGIIQKAVTENVEQNSLSNRLNLKQQLAPMQLEAELRKGGESADAVLKSIRQCAEYTPALCADWVMKNQNLSGLAKQRFLEEVIAIWADKSPQAALTWLDSEKSLAENGKVYANAISSLARTNADSAAKWLHTHSSIASLENWKIVMNIWAEQNPVDALRWFNSNFNKPMKDALLPTLLASIHDDSSRINLIAETNPETIELALQPAIKANTYRDPALAKKLAEHLKSDIKREKVLQDMNSTS